MSAEKWTYWLWRGPDIVGSVRAEAGLSDARVIAIAVQRYRWLPLSVGGFQGRDAEAILSRATVKTYPPLFN